MSSALRAPGGAWEQGGGPSVAPSQPRAPQQKGLNTAAIQSALGRNDVAEAMDELGQDVQALAKQIHEQDMAADLQSRKVDLQEKFNTIVSDPKSGLINLKGKDAMGVQGTFKQHAELLKDDYLDGLGGRYIKVAENVFRGVRSDFMRVMAKHELNERDAMYAAAQKGQETSMMSTIAAAASSDNDAYLDGKILSEVQLAMVNVKGGPEQLKAKKQSLLMKGWGTALRAKMQLHPESALELMARIKAGDDPYWKAENFDSELLVSMYGEARDAYKSTMGANYKNMVEVHGLEAATKSIQEDAWLSESEKGGLIREAKQIKRAQIADMEAAERLSNKQRREGVVTHWVKTGKELTDKDFYDRGFRGEYLEAVKRAQATFFRKAPQKTDVATLLMLSDMAENGWTNPDTGKFESFEQQDLARPEFTKALENITKEDLFGKVLPAIKKAGERGASSQKVRTEALGVFKARTKSVYGKNSEKLWQAEEQWNLNYDALVQKLGREPSSEELSEMGNKMMGEVVTGSGFFGNSSAKRWEARYAIRTEGKSLVPDDAREAIIKKYVEAGLPEPDTETIFQRYVDPRNAAWLAEALNDNSGEAQAADIDLW